MMNQKTDMKTLDQRVIKVIDELADINQGYIELGMWHKTGILETVLNDLKESFLEEIMNS